MNLQLANDGTRLIIALSAFLLLLVILFFIYRYLFRFVQKKVKQTPGLVDDFILEAFKVPVLWVFYWILLKLFTHFFLNQLSIFPTLVHINTLLLIFSIAWLSVKLVHAGAYYIQTRLDLNASDNLRARKSLTQIRVFKGIIDTIIVLIAIAVGLMTFQKARTIGLSLLTSAGVLGLIVGFAAQKSLGMILAGIQLAITQPIRLDDVVIVEGEWGRIEEITLTYVVVRIWDDRRLVLPVNYFLEKPFQNWTRTNAQITGTIYLRLDYAVPVDRIREFLTRLLEGNPDWDGRVQNVQVTDTNERYKEIRVLVSSSDSSKNWNLRTYVREKLIDFVQENYPDAFAGVRIKSR
jgi:small-conductance mechanosensitive channel